MTDMHLTFTQPQRDLLTRILSEEVKHKRVEIHRTEFSREYRHQLEDEERQLQEMLSKLEQAFPVGA